MFLVIYFSLHYNLHPLYAGLLLSLFGFIYSLAQTQTILFLLVRVFSKNSVFILSFVLTGIASTILLFSSTILIAYMSVVPLGIGIGISVPLLSNLLSKTINAKEFSDVMTGITLSTRVFSALIGGILIEHGRYGAFDLLFFCGFLLSAIMVLMALFYEIQTPNVNTKEIVV
jgi:hypothetical protein